MNKFTRNLAQDANAIKAQRGQLVASETKDCQEQLIKEIEGRKRQAELKILNLSDVSPENTYSLRPAGPNFKSKNWVDEMQAAKIDLLNIKVELMAAKETMTEWFTEEK